MARADFLDEIFAARTSANPVLPVLLDAAVRRRQAETEPVAGESPEAK